MRTVLTSNRNSKLFTCAPKDGAATTASEFRCLRPATIASAALAEQAGEVLSPKQPIYPPSLPIVEAFECEN